MILKHGSPRAAPRAARKPELYLHMPRLLLIISVLALVVAFIARWWFGLRVLAAEGERICRCDLNTWLPAPGDHAKVHRAEGTAAEFGEQLRNKALVDWASEMPKAARSRENNRRFGLAVPPLSIVIAVFALIGAKVPWIGAIVIIFAATAVAGILAMTSITPELQAITRAAKKARDARAFPQRDDESVIVRCAYAHAWRKAFPPLFRLIQGG